MIEHDIQLIDFGKKNTLRSQSINLDSGLELVFLFSTEDEKFADLFERKILDTTLDSISLKNSYKSFSHCLEELNQFIHNWGANIEDMKLSALIGVYDGKNFHFSNIGTASVILGNLRGNIIEITDKKDRSKDFSYISSGDITEGETLILSTKRLLDTLSKDDIADGLGTKYLRSCGENIEHILLHEDMQENVACMSLRRQITLSDTGPSFLSRCQHLCLKALDNDIVKKILGYLYHIRDTILQKQKHTIQIIFGLGMFLSVLVIYLFVSSFFQFASSTQDVENYEEKLLEVRTAVEKASQNINDIDRYMLYIEEAENLLREVEAVKLFEADSKKLRSDISVLESQVNGIESFAPSGDLVQHRFSEPMKPVKLISQAGKLFAVTEKGVYGPLNSSETAENYNYAGLSASETFIDATEVGNDIVLQSSAGKVIAFSSGKRFSVLNVSGQDTWFNSPLIRSYNQNLYVLSESRDQIYMHRKQGDIFAAGNGYLSQEDSNTLKNIKSIAIDGGIYILKEDGSMLKFFRSPEYRLESLVLNRLPRNYTSLIEQTEVVQMSASARYVYILLGNTLFVFEPNNTRVTDVKSLRFMGQIQSEGSDILAYYVNNDGDISIADENGVYRVKFDIEDFGIVIR